MICNSIPQAVRSIARRFGPKPLYMDIMAGVEVNWVEFKNRAWAAAAGLIDAGVEPGEAIALIGFDGPEAMIFETGCQAAGAAAFVVPATLAADDMANVLLVSRCTRFVTADGPAAPGPDVAAALESLSTLITEIPVELLRTHRFDNAVILEGDDDDPVVESRVRALGPELAATAFMQTMPDGRELVVALSHANLQSVAAAVTARLMADEGDAWTTLLPVSSGFGRVAAWYAAMLSGGVFTVAPAGRGPVEALFLTQPSFAVCDGDIAATIDQEIMAELDLLEGARGRVTRWGFRHACARTLAGRDSHGMTDSLADLAVERLVRDIPGGRLRALLSCGPDLPADARCRLHTAGIDLWTVFAPATVSYFMAVTSDESIRAGSVGIPLPGTAVRPTPQGELMVEGPLVMTCELGQSPNVSPDLEGTVLKSGYRGRVDDDGFVYIDAGAQ